MKNLRLKYAVIVLGASILAIIITQFYWISASYDIKEELFARSVNEAMINSVKKLQSFRVVSLMEDAAVNDTLTTVILKKEPHKDGRKKQVTTSVWLSDSENFSLSVCSEEETPPDDVLKNEVKAIILPKGCGGDNDSASTVFVKHVVKQVISEFNSDVPVEEYISSEKINTVLLKELSDKNINTGFEFSVVDDKDSVKTELCSQGFSKEMLADANRVRLFPENLIARSDYLVVAFPSKTRYILGSLWLSLILTLALTALIIITFVFTLRNFIRHNRLLRIKDDFMNNMTHELKTPIATINLAADSLINEKVITDHDQVRFYANAIKQENLRMNRHVEQVLQLSLIENNSFSVEPVKTDLNYLINSEVLRFSLAAQAKNGNIDFTPCGMNCEAYIDVTYFQHAISNLLDNAIRYTEKAPDVKVRLKKDNGNYIITVSDNGIGIDPAYRQKIFEKFFRVPTGNLHNVKGFGLGLSYVDAVVRSHHGNIRVHSVPGEGSTFTITIPVYKP